MAGLEGDSNMVDEADRRRAADRRCKATAHPLAWFSWQGQRQQLRRRHEQRDQFVDRYPSHLRYVAVAVLILCNMDAFLTLHILDSGGEELNPFMETLLQASLPSFFYTKLLLTALGLVVLLVYYHFRWFRVLRVGYLLFGALAVYLALISYQIYLIAHV